MDTEWERINSLTGAVLACAVDVRRGLGQGFVEKVYENALVHELRKRGLEVKQQAQIKVWWDGVVVGDYVADLIVEATVLVELKAIPPWSVHTKRSASTTWKPPGYRSACCSTSAPNASKSNA